MTTAPAVDAADRHDRSCDLAETAIEARDLRKTFGRVGALNGVSFTAQAGAVLALVGPNGAGKSTTVKILATLSRADAGLARVAGLDVVREAGRVRRAIGLVAQRSGADLDATGRENLVLQAQLHGLRSPEAKSRAGKLLKRFDLVDVGDRLARTYSGGMQRRLDVALGLVHRPAVLFLDEPTTGLDPEVRAVLWDEVERLATQDGLTILMTTHYLEEADRLARTVAIIDRGTIVAQGSPSVLKRELRGDAIQVQLPAPQPDGPPLLALARVPGVRDVAVDGQLLRARADDGAAAVPLMLAALEAAGVPVAAATVARPSLDDVYLRYAGRAFNADDRKEVSQ